MPELVEGYLRKVGFHLKSYPSALNAKIVRFQEEMVGADRRLVVAVTVFVTLGGLV